MQEQHSGTKRLKKLNTKRNSAFCCFPYAWIEFSGPTSDFYAQRGIELCTFLSNGFRKQKTKDLFVVFVFRDNAGYSLFILVTPQMVKSQPFSLFKICHNVFFFSQSN